MLLAIYLNDHLAAATGGLELAKRAAVGNRDSSHGPFLAQLAAEIEEDRQSLVQIMGALGVKVDRIKVAAGWAAEKLGRLKLNGQLRGYSPLSRVVELEGLELGAHGKLALWRSLEQLEPGRSGASRETLQALAARAERQIEQLEVHRLRAAAQALST